MKEREIELGKLKELKTLLDQAYRTLDSLRGEAGHLKNYKANATQTEEKRRDLQAEREALPKRFWSKRPKDKEIDSYLAHEISECEKSKVSTQKLIDFCEEEVKIAEQQFAEAVARLEALRPGMDKIMNDVRSIKVTHEMERAFYRELDKLRREVTDAEISIREARAKIEKLEWTKGEWENGRYLTLSLAEILAKKK